MNKFPIQKLSIVDMAIGFDRKILEEINLEFVQGERIFLNGKSGEGKSTFMKTLAALISPMAGDYFINDVRVNDLSFEEFLPYRLNIGYSFDSGGLLSNLTLWDNLMLPILYHGDTGYREAEKRVTHLVDLFQLQRFKNERPASVPGGIRKATCVARAFVLQPSVLFLDEPTTGLNDEGLHALDLLVQEQNVRADTVLIFTSRYKSFVERWTQKEVSLSGDIVVGAA